MTRRLMDLLFLMLLALMLARCSRASDAHSLMPTRPPPPIAAAAALDLPAPPTVTFALAKASWQPPRLVISEMLIDPLMMEDSMRRVHRIG